MSSKRFMVVGNWKMNPETLGDAKKLCTQYKQIAGRYERINLSLVPPVAFLEPLVKQAKGIVTLGAQNIYYEDHGSYTGAVSIPMVESVGAQTVLIGHSERRHLFAVSEDVIAHKINSAIEHGMPMIVCFGEQERDEQGNFTEELERQIATIITPFVSHGKLSLLTLAYEPVWAIGKQASRPVSEDELFSTILLIKNIVAKHVGEHRARRIPLIYGGSVNKDNARRLSRVPGVRGFLLGRASLSGTELRGVCEEISK